LWLKQLANNFDTKIGKLTFIFTSDNYILKVNQTYLNHDYYTDVITFDYSSEKEISGDIFISLDTVASNSKQFNVSFQDELHRVIVHGVLHLLGFKDKSEDEQKEMRKEEDFALNILKTSSL
jgi:rRNA maturation RNase YbeY